MKKNLAWLFLFTILLTACAQRQPTATDLLAKLLTLPDTPVVRIYFDGAMSEEEGYLDPQEGAELYGGYFPGELAQEYAVALSKDDCVYELHLYYALDVGKADRIEMMLRKRQTLLQKKENYLYDPDSPAASATVWRHGKWVALIVTQDNDQARVILEKNI